MCCDSILLTIQSFTIKYEGKKEIIEYEDDITFGELESILAKSVDLTDVTKPRVNLPEYRMSILLKVLRKASLNASSTINFSLSRWFLNHCPCILCLILF